MKAVISGAIFLVIAVIIGLFILLGILGVTGIAKGIQFPGAGFFEIFGKIFGFFEQQVFLASQQTKDAFCDKQLKDAVEVCKLTPKELKKYCDSDEKASLCENPTENMKGFCKLKIESMDHFCKDQKSFFSACDMIMMQAEKNKWNPLVFLRDQTICK